MRGRDVERRARIVGVICDLHALKPARIPRACAHPACRPKIRSQILVEQRALLGGGAPRTLKHLPFTRSEQWPTAQVWRVLDASSLPEDTSNERSAVDHCYRRYCHLKSGETLGSDTQ